MQGGVESHCENLYPRLARRGCEVVVLTRKPYVDPTRTFFEGVELRAIDCPKSKYLEAIAHTFKGVLMARRMKGKILHLHAIGPSLFAPLARLLGMKVIVTHHGPDYKRKKWNFFAKAFLRLCEWAGVTFADRLIVITRDIQEDLRRKYHKDSTVIPNGVVVAPAKNGSGELAAKFGLQKERYILAVGRFVPEKGFHDLIDAFARLDAPGWKLVIAGGADHEDSYSQSVREKALMNSSVVLTGFLKGDALRELYGQAGLFVLPSYHEGLPIVLLEAMSHGLSCLATDIPANRNVGLSEDRFFAPGNVSDLAEKMRVFLNSPLSQEARARQIDGILENYDWEKIADQTLRVYKSSKDEAGIRRGADWLSLPEIYPKEHLSKKAWKGMAQEWKVYLNFLGHRKPQNRFVIFAQGRTGSTLLKELLNCHPAVHCDEEILYYPKLFPGYFIGRKSSQSKKMSYGFKLKIYQLTEVQKIRDPRRFVLDLAERGWKIIHLKRENVLRQTISFLYAEKKSRFHLWKDDKRPLDDKKIEVNCAQLVEMMQKRDEYYKMENEVLKGLPAHPLSYEKDLLPPHGQQEAMDGVFGFLGLPTAAVSTRLMKSVSDRLEDVISNYSELERQLKNSKYEQYLRDVHYAGKERRW